jgi:hypothetical protein
MDIGGSSGGWRIGERNKKKDIPLAISWGEMSPTGRILISLAGASCNLVVVAEAFCEPRQL